MRRRELAELGLPKLSVRGFIHLLSSACTPSYRILRQDMDGRFFDCTNSLRTRLKLSRLTSVFRSPLTEQPAPFTYLLEHQHQSYRVRARLRTFRVASKKGQLCLFCVAGTELNVTLEKYPTFVLCLVKGHCSMQETLLSRNVAAARSSHDRDISDNQVDVCSGT